MLTAGVYKKCLNVACDLNILIVKNDLTEVEVLRENIVCHVILGRVRCETLPQL